MNDSTIITFVQRTKNEIKVIDNSVDYVNSLYEQGHNITFFTARLEKHREVTEKWLKKHNFKYHGRLKQNYR